MQKHANIIKESPDLGDFVEKMKVTEDNVVWTIFLGVVIVAI